MCNIDGNEHGASKTNVDTVPTFAVSPLESVPTTPGVPLPPAAKTASMWVCHKIFVDRSRGEVVVNPVVSDPGHGRPLYLVGVTATGAHFEGELPRDNYSIFNLNGGEDNDQRITLDECEKENVAVRKVQTGGAETHVLVEGDSGLKDGATIAVGPAGAVDNNLVHGQYENLTDVQLNDFLNDLPVPAGV
jgi:hypothetical protein